MPECERTSPQLMLNVLILNISKVNYLKIKVTSRRCRICYGNQPSNKYNMMYLNTLQTGKTIVVYNFNPFYTTHPSNNNSRVTGTFGRGKKLTLKKTHNYLLCFKFDFLSNYNVYHTFPYIFAMCIYINGKYIYIYIYTYVILDTSVNTHKCVSGNMR